MKKVYLLHSKGGVHLIASNFKVVYEALQDMASHALLINLKSYSWYCFYLSENEDIFVPKQKGGDFVISKRPIISKYIGRLNQNSCAIPSFKKPN